VPEVSRSLDYKCLGRWRLEICPLPALLSSGFDHLERTVLPPAEIHNVDAADGRHSLSLCGLPLQLCEL